MTVAIAGGHGKIALRLTRRVADRSETVISLDSEPLRGTIPRDDVAAVLDALLRRGDAARRLLYVNSGEDPIEQALDDRIG
jgi:nucleoside-diphosphate-sugar epimerase